MSVNPEALPDHDDDISVPLSDRPDQSRQAPRGGANPGEAAGGEFTVPEAGRTGRSTKNDSPAPIPDEPMPPQD